MQPKRDENGKFPAYAWPGGYQIVYTVADCEIICPDCANGENGSIASTDSDADEQWRIESMDIYYEGPPVQCANCNQDIESAYGDPEADDGSE